MDPFKISLEFFLNYVVSNNLMTEDDVINEIVAEINIGILAPKYGMQKNDNIPSNVLESYERLCQVGYTKYLLTDEKIAKVMAKWKVTNFNR